MSDSVTVLAAFLKDRLDEDERYALAASGLENQSAGAEHWLWKCTEDDEPLNVDLAIAGNQEALWHGDHYMAGLHSVEKYPHQVGWPAAPPCP